MAVDGVAVGFWILLGSFIGECLTAYFIAASLLVFVVVLLGWLLGLVFHEYGHAYVAYKNGDKAIGSRGGLSLSVFHYMLEEPVGSILLPLLIFVFGGIPLPGAAVRIDTAAIRAARLATVGQGGGFSAGISPALALSLVALAGPLASCLFGGFMRLLIFPLDHAPTHRRGCLYEALTVVCYFQALATCLNLLPLPGLDGWGLIEPWLSDRCVVKRWLNESPWNRKTAMLLTFGFIFVMAATTDFLSSLTQPILFLYQLQPAALASGFRSFYHAWPSF